jgi:hypothetical protein
VEAQLIEKGLEQLHAFRCALAVVSDDEEIIDEHIDVNSHARDARSENLGDLFRKVTEH